MKGDEVTDLRARVERLPAWTPGGRSRGPDLIERQKVLALLDQPTPPDPALPSGMRFRPNPSGSCDWASHHWVRDGAGQTICAACNGVIEPALATAPTPPDGLEALVREFLSLHDEAHSPVIWCDGKCRTVRALRAATPPEPAP
jgi:hypothetical protein